LKSLRNYLSNEWWLILNGVRTSELWSFQFQRCVLSRKFQSARPSIFWPYPLVGISDWFNSWFVGTITSWSSWISKNILLLASEVELNVYENNVFLWVDQKMSMILWFLGVSCCVSLGFQGHHHWFTSKCWGSNDESSPWFLLCPRCPD
jgi:hypothetical protein